MPAKKKSQNVSSSDSEPSSEIIPAKGKKKVTTKKEATSSSSEEVRKPSPKKKSIKKSSSSPIVTKKKSSKKVSTKTPTKKVVLSSDSSSFVEELNKFKKANVSPQKEKKKKSSKKKASSSSPVRQKTSKKKVSSSSSPKKKTAKKKPTKKMSSSSSSPVRQKPTKKVSSSSEEEKVTIVVKPNKAKQIPITITKTSRKEDADLAKDIYNGKKKVDISTLSESQIYFLAVAAYEAKDVSPLLKMHQKEISDRYYWLYLAHDEAFFYHTMEIEMFRRRDTKMLSLINVSKYHFSLKYLHEEKRLTNIKDGAVVVDDRRFYDDIIGHESYFVYQLAEQGMVDNYYSSTDPNLGIEESLKYYPIKFINIVKKVASKGGIPAGGFVAGLINPIYELIPIENRYVNFTYDNDDKNDSVFPNDHPYTMMRYGYEHNRENPESAKDVKIADFEEAVLVFMARNLDKSDLYSSYDWESVVEAKKKYKKYNLEAKLESLRRHIYIRDKEICQKLFRKAGDVDIFVTGEDYQQKVDSIVSYLTKEAKYKKSQITCSEFATTFNFGSGWPKIQIIKRAYSSVEEILAGFDIDPSRAALLWKNDAFKPVATASFIDSVVYGTDLVVPSRQSETFNYRIAKYLSKGYEPYFVDNILSIIRKTQTKTLHIEDDYPGTIREEEEKDMLHTAKDLVKYIFTEGHVWTWKSVSDYAEQASYQLAHEEHFKREIEAGAKPIDIRAHSITNEGLEPEIKDVMYLANNILRIISSQWFSHITKETNTKKIRSSKSKWLETAKASKLDYCIVTMVTALNWRTVDPGSQITGSFNPTHLDYLAGKGEIEKLPIINEYLMKNVKDVVMKTLPAVMVDIVLAYLQQDYRLVYAYLTKIQQLVDKQDFEENKGLKILKDYRRGKETPLIPSEY